MPHTPEYERLRKVTQFPLTIAAMFLALAALSQAVADPPVYQIHRAGLFDADHTRSDGHQESMASGMNAGGAVIGTSMRYVGFSIGESAWLFSNGVNTRLGFTGLEYTAADGAQISQPFGISDTGAIIGLSYRLGPGTGFGSAAWHYLAGTTTRIGYFDAEHTRIDGYQSSWATQINPAGVVLGESNRYNGANDAGQSAWVYVHGVTTRIGLIDADHTHADGTQVSVPLALNVSGQAAGTAARFSGASFMGSSAWLYSGNATTRIGLTDAEHTRSDGYQFSGIAGYNPRRSTNAAGQVIGASRRYSGSTQIGKSAWLYSNGATNRIGYTDALHTRADGAQDSIIVDLNDAGQVLGVSERYVGSADFGWSAWRHHNGVTTPMGLTDAEHTRNDGFQLNLGAFQNDSGDVAGGAYRYIGAAQAGASSWIYTSGTTSRIGLIDPQHTRADGYQYSSPIGNVPINASGDVIGTSDRFNGAISLGESGWYFDNDTDLTHALVFSTREDGFARTAPEILLDDGVVLGAYDLYDGASLVGERAFRWTLADGFDDLGSLVSGGLTAAGWQSLASILSGTSWEGALNQNTIVGLGRVIGQSEDGQVYVLTLIPEPAAILMILATSVVMLRRRGSRSGFRNAAFDSACDFHR